MGRSFPKFVKIQTFVIVWAAKSEYSVYKVTKLGARPTKLPSGGTYQTDCEKESAAWLNLNIIECFQSVPWYSNDKGHVGVHDRNTNMAAMKSSANILYQCICIPLHCKVIPPQKRGDFLSTLLLRLIPFIKQF